MVYKLSYFNIRGLAESTRLMLIDQGVAFEDHRIERADWPKFKAEMTFGQIPVFYDGDEQIYQSATINRHLARKLNLNGSNESEITFIDMFYEAVRDVRKKYLQVIYGNYEQDKENLIKVILPEQLTTVQKVFKTFCNGEKYIAGEKISYADYEFFEVLDMILVLDPTALDNFPTLKAFHGRMNSRPTLKSYLEKRAVSNIAINGNGKQ
ncbi:unnamed protein product [Auanema sp. JU1783]|nr:unnamed protein product [Auanema sp. JU1783]